MDALLTSLSGLGPFLLYFSLSILMLLLFKWLYVLVTPWDEWKLIKENQNLAAAIALVGAFVGFSLAVASAAANSVSLLDFAVWGLIALVAQLMAFALVRLVFLPRIAERINEGQVSAGAVVGGLSVAVGLLNAACITY
jgi:putative membrane protein